MKTIYLTDEVNQEMQDKVIEALNEEGEITFYLNSEGGREQYAMVIVDLINKNFDRVTLIANFQIASAAFIIFFQSKCKREILDGTEGLAHMRKITVKMDGNKEMWNVDSWRVKEMLKQDIKEEKFLKSLGVSKKNRKLFLKGYDIYFSTKQLRKMLKKQNEHL